MISFRSVSKADVRRWMWFGLFTLAAIQVYYVREMVAALIIFSFLFTFVGVTALILFLLHRTSQRTLAWAGKRCGPERDSKGDTAL
jgi:hypothetical protein